MVSADPSIVSAAFRAGLGADWLFLCDEGREVIKRIGILDETEGEYAYRCRPFTFVLRLDLTIHKVYDGWFFVGRPTIEELRYDLRHIVQTNSNYGYEAFDTPRAKSIRIPQQEWADGAPSLVANGLEVASGVVKSFDLGAGNGEISRNDGSAGGDVFFNFTAIPGEGYRTIRPGTPVKFEVVDGAMGPTPSRQGGPRGAGWRGRPGSLRRRRSPPLCQRKRRTRWSRRATGRPPRRGRQGAGSGARGRVLRR